MRQAAATARPAVTLVVTTGCGSMDLYSQRLARRLETPVLESDIYQRSARRFGVAPFGLTSFRLAGADLAFVRALRRLDGALHLPNQHLARYGPFAGRPYVVTVHDIIRQLDCARARALISRPNARDRLLLARDRNGIRSAAGVITVSETTRRDVIEHLGLPEERVAVARNGIDHDVFRPSERRLFDFPYILFVGSEQPRKNLIALLRATRALVERPGFDDFRLVKVGRPGNPRYRAATEDAIRELCLEDRVVFTGWLSDADLAAAYSGAECLVLPSEYEGFGMPPVEAMACGCPVVASSRGSLGEVLGDAALLLSSCDPDSLAEATGEISRDRALARALTERGRARAREFTWERTAAETRMAYERFAERLAERRADPPRWRPRSKAPALETSS